MVDILKRVFQTFSSQGEHLGEDEAAGSTPPADSALLVGENRVCRSLLVLAAVTAASEAGVRVQFFTQTKIQSLPLSVQKCVKNLSPESLKKIKFSYPRTLEDLLQQVASLHEPGSPRPSLIIVDRLKEFLCGPGGTGLPGLHTGERSSAAHLAALLCDTSAFLARVSSSGSCRVLASFWSGEAGAESSGTDPVLDVLDRYFSTRCTLDKDASYEAAAAGLQEIWNVYLSGPGVTGVTGVMGIMGVKGASGSEDPPGLEREWQLLVATDESMEFKLVKK